MADIEKLKQALAAYTGEPDSLNQFVSVAVAELGENWAETIYDTLSDLTEEERGRLDHAFQYYAATTAWNEAQSYLTQEAPLDVDLVRERIPILEHWLAFFQDAGLQVVAQLKEKVDSVPGTSEAAVLSDIQSDPKNESNVPSDSVTETTDTAETDSPSEPAESGVAEVAEKPKSKEFWIVDKVRKQVDMTRAVQAWVAARCVSLGNREVFAYPYYGFVVDLMHQTRDEIQEILNSGDLLQEVNAVDPGIVKELQDYQISLDKDLEIAAQNGVSEETSLINDELTGEDAKRILGQLDTSNTPEFSGPAPDGFEVILDTDSEIDEQPIKDEYRQIENVVLSEQTQNNEKNTSQTAQNSVKKKLSFTLGNKKPAGT